MKKFLQKLFGKGNAEKFEPVPADFPKIIEEIKIAESAGNIEPGRVIYKFIHNDLSMQLDIEITGTYRLVALCGPEKKYSFSIRCAKGEYSLLLDGIEVSLLYLDGSRRLADLPKTDLVKAHYFGNQEN